MATVTKPIALDESLNTTEQTPRNVADVLAQELARIAGRQASDVDYDNTDSGLTADNVQDAIDELKSDIPTVNDGTLTIQQNGETKGTFTANQSGNSTVNIETPTTNIQTAVDEFETYNGGLLSSLKVALSPIQDLSHGDPSPTNICPISGHTEVKVVDDGKNRLPITAETQTRNGITVTICKDAGGNVLSIKKTGTATANTWIVLSEDVSLENGDYIFTGLNSQSGTKLYLHTSVSSKDIFEGTFTYSQENDGNFSLVFQIVNGDSNELTAYPMIRLASDTDPTYVPYNGYQITVNLGGTYYSGTLDVVSGVFTPDTADVDLGTLTWTYNSGTQRFTSSVTGLKNLPVRTAPMTCEVYKVIDDGRAIGDVPNGSIYNGNMSSNVYVHDSRFTVPTDLATALSGYKLVYPLATPTSIQLSPTMVKALVGENHLSAPLDGQEITESEYRELFTWNEVESYVNAHSGGGSGMNYSTNEQVIGTWIDGKPVYECTFYLATASLSSKEFSISTGLSNIKKILTCTGVLTNGSETYMLPFERLTERESIRTFARVNSDGTVTLNVITGAGSSSVYSTVTDVYVTITYTKTTD